MELRFKDYVPLYATGLQIGYDPEQSWCGSVADSWSSAFLWCFFTNHRRLTVKIQPKDKGCRIEISGEAKDSEKHFDRISTQEYGLN